MKKAVILILSTFLMLVLASCTPGGVDDTEFSANLSAAQEVPAPILPPGTNPTGEVQATLVGNTLTVNGEVSGLTGEPTGAHIHEGIQGVSGEGDIVCDLELDDGVMRGAGITGKCDFTDAQVQTLLSNGFYVNVHTEANQAGEARGQLNRLLLD